MQIGFALYNTIKFYRHRSYSLGLFYVFMIVNLVIRTLYFFVGLFEENSYLNVILLCSPAAFSLSIGLCQAMNYVVLYIRLDSYAKHREKKHGEEISEEDLELTTKREMFATIIFTIIILAYPIIITVLLSVHGS